jgi:hypothetical protein
MLQDYGSSPICQGKMTMIKIISTISHPVCPTFIFDDTTRIFISLIGLLALSTIFYRIVRYYSG